MYLRKLGRSYTIQIVRGSAGRLLNLRTVQLFGLHDFAANNHVSHRFDTNMDTQPVLLCYIHDVRTPPPPPQNLSGFNVAADETWCE